MYAITATSLIMKNVHSEKLTNVMAQNHEIQPSRKYPNIR